MSLLCGSSGLQCSTGELKFNTSTSATATRQLLITNISATERVAFQLEPPSGARGYFMITNRSPATTRLVPGVTQTVTIQCSAPRGFACRDYLTIRTSQSVTMVHLTANENVQRGEVSLPSSVNMGMCALGERVVKRIALANSTSTSCVYTVSVQSQAGGVSDFRVSPASGRLQATNGVATIAVEYHPARRITAHADITVSLRADDGRRMPVLKCHLVGTNKNNNEEDAIARKEEEDEEEVEQQQQQQPIVTALPSPVPIIASSQRKSSSAAGRKGGASRRPRPRRHEWDYSDHADDAVDDELSDCVAFNSAYTAYTRHEKLLVANPSKLRVGQLMLTPQQVSTMKARQQRTHTNASKARVMHDQPHEFPQRQDVLSPSSPPPPSFKSLVYSWENRDRLVRLWTRSITKVIERRRLLQRLRMLQTSEHCVDDLDIPSRLQQRVCTTTTTTATTTAIQLTKPTPPFDHHQHHQEDIFALDDHDILSATATYTRHPLHSHIMSYTSFPLLRVPIGVETTTTL